MCCEVDDGLVQHLAHSSPFADTPGVCFHPSTFQADDGNGERDVDDVIVAVLILLGILVISGPILASVALAKVSSLRQRVDRMTRELAALRGADTPSQPAAPVEPAVFDSHVAAPAPSPGSRPAPDLPPQDPPRDFGEPLPRKEPLPPPIPHSVDVQPEQVTTPAPAQVPSEPGVIDTVVTRIKAWFDHMLPEWLGILTEHRGGYTAGPTFVAGERRYSAHLIPPDPDAPAAEPPPAAPAGDVGTAFASPG